MVLLHHYVGSRVLHYYNKAICNTHTEVYYGFPNHFNKYCEIVAVEFVADNTQLKSNWEQIYSILISATLKGFCIFYKKHYLR